MPRSVAAGSWTEKVVTSPMRGSVHNQVVDTYAMQHPEEYGRSAKSYAAHLLGLCCAVEHAGDQKLYWSIARWLDGARAIDKPELLTHEEVVAASDGAAVGIEALVRGVVRRMGS